MIISYLLITFHFFLYIVCIAQRNIIFPLFRKESLLTNNTYILKQFDARWVLLITRNYYIRLSPFCLWVPLFPILTSYYQMIFGTCVYFIQLFHPGTSTWLYECVFWKITDTVVKVILLKYFHKHIRCVWFPQLPLHLFSIMIGS